MRVGTNSSTRTLAGKYQGESEEQMAKYYGGKVTLTFNAHDIVCDGSLEDFARNLFPSWEGELVGVDGEIELECDDDEEDDEE